MSANDYIWVKRRDWENLVAKVDSIGFPDGSGRVHHSPRQVALSVASATGASGTVTVPVKILSMVAYNRYLVDVYSDGMFYSAGDVDNTGSVHALGDPRPADPRPVPDTGIVLFIRQIATGSTIPNNTILDATPVGDHYEASVPRWL